MIKGRNTSSNECASCVNEVETGNEKVTLATARVSALRLWEIRCKFLADPFPT